MSKWIEDARFRKENRKWLGYSGEIAMRILALIDNDKELSQKKIAESLNVSPQYVNKIIQGRENLTLETIGKLSDVLQFELISFPPYKYQNTYIPTGTVTTGKIVVMPTSVQQSVYRAFNERTTQSSGVVNF